MKSIKKYFKVILCFMAFAFASLLFTFAPNVRTYAALNKAKTNYNMAIKAVKMPRATFVDANGNQSLRVPLLKSGNSWQDTAKYTIRVVDPSFTSHDYKVGAEAGQETNERDADYFAKINVDSDEFLEIKTLNNGKYDILYIMEEGGELLYSNTYSVTVENVSYELDFAAREGSAKAGLKTLLPETVKLSTSDADKIELPTANVKNKDTGAYVSSTGVTLKVFDAYGTELDLSTSNIVKKDAETNKYYLYPTKEGKYTIEYTYAYGNNPPKKSFTVEVKKDFVAPTSSDLTINIPTMPSVELGQKDIKLPDVVVNSKTKDNIEHNVKSIVISKGNLSTTLSNNTFKFDMTKTTFNLASYTTDMLGDWYVEYTIEDAYGNTKTIKVTIDGVKDNTNPEVFMAYNYEVDAETKLPVDEDKIDTTVASEFKSQLGYNELYFPAIYAKDNVTSYKDFIFVRYIQSSRTNTIYYLDNIMLKDKEAYNISSDEAYSSQMNVSGDANIGKPNKAVKFKFNTENQSEMAGEYTLGYQVYAKDITKQTGYLYVSNTTMYTFEILSTDLRTPTTSVEHTVEINNIKDNYSVASDGKFTVNINANETKRGESTTNVDKRLKTAVFYYYTAKSTATTLAQDVENAYRAAKEALPEGSYFGSKNLIETDAFVNYMKDRYNGFAYAEQKNKNNYNVELKGYEASYLREAHIVAMSIDDDSNIALATKKLNLKDMTDVAAPTAHVVNAHDLGDVDLTALTVKQGTTVRLPDVSFEDDDKSLSMSVLYYVDSPVNDIIGLDYQSPTGKNFKNNISGLSYIYGGSIKADKVGTYHVIYTATDDAGNTTYMYFTFESTLASDPILKVSATGDDIKSSSASTITGETGMRVNFDAVLWSNDLSQNLTESATIDYTVEDGGKDWQSADDVTSFIFKEQGEYKITFTASYESAGVTYTAEPQIFTITVTRPELKWNETLNESDYSYAPLGSVVTLPDLSASQGDVKAKVELKVTFKGDTQTVKKNIVNGTTVWQFTTNETLTGDYKVEYTAITAYSTITKSFTIKVGDNVPPVITIDHEDDLAKEIVYDGKTAIEYTIKLVKTSTSTNGGRKLEVTITNGKDVKTYNTNLVLQDKDKNGELKDISWDSLTVELYNGDSVMSTSSTGTNTKTYSISATGEYKLVIKATDSNTNPATKEIKFTVKTESDVEKSNDTVVGVVLIVLSLVVLAGVILFFAFTGKGKGGKTKANNQVKAKSTKGANKEVAKEEVEEVEATATTEEAESEAKSGDVE